METKNSSLIAARLRRWSLEMTTRAGSGHPTSSLSAVELMVVLFFDESDFFRFDIGNPEDIRNDRLIFSKGHASPLYYALWAMAGAIDVEELKTYRKFQSRLEGHPTRAFPYTEVPTGSLGQGLGAGMGMALGLKYLYTWKSPEDLPNVFVLLGDSELAEGSVWEAMQLAAYYKLQNLIAIIDVNRLGQRGETMQGWDIQTIAKKFEAFGWRTILVEDGHAAQELQTAYRNALGSRFGNGSGEDMRPVAVIARTVKGKGVSFLENHNGWHGKTLSLEELDVALAEIHDDEGGFVLKSRALPKCDQPQNISIASDFHKTELEALSFSKGEMVAVRKVYGKTLAEIAGDISNIVVLDAEVSNSTFSQDFQKKYPSRFFEMFIAEQNMVSAAVGLARCGWLPFVSTFGAFFSRAFDQIRMAAYAKVPMVLVGSHVGVSIGEDGASQMALEDIAMMRSIWGSTVLYPSDAVSMRALLREASKQKFGVTYVRMTRAETPVLYAMNEKFPIGGSKILRKSEKDSMTIVVAGSTVHEALKAYEMALREKGIFVRIIDLYSIQPIDIRTLREAARETGKIIVVEDHLAHGGIADAVREALAEDACTVISLAVRKVPMSGKPEELLHYEAIDAEYIFRSIDV